MLYYNLEDYSRRLILGSNHTIASTSIFKRSMLTGYLSILVISICLIYATFDAYFSLFNGLLYYFTLIDFTVIAFFLNRSGRYEFSKILLLISTLFIVFLFSTTEPMESANYLNFFPIIVAAFALFGYKAIYKGVLFTLLSIGLFLLLYFYEIRILPVRSAVGDSEIANFLVHYFISISATILIIVFLIKLNQTIESNLIQKDNHLIKTTKELKASKQRFELAISGSNAGIYDWDIQNNIIYHSPKWKKLLGYEANELKLVLS